MPGEDRTALEGDGQLNWHLGLVTKLTRLPLFARAQMSQFQAEK